MKQKKLFLILSSLVLAGSAFGIVVSNNAFMNGTEIIRADETYTMTLDANNPVTAANYSPAAVVKTDGTITVNNMLVKATTDGYAKLAPHGTIYNYSSTATYNGRITGMNSIKVDYAGSDLSLQVSRDLSGKIFTDKMNVTSGSEIDLSSLSPNYFILKAGDTELDINKITIKYSCSERSGLTVDQLAKVYSGKLGNTVYKANISGTSATIKTTNLETNVTYNGTVSIEDGMVKIVLPAGNLFFSTNEARTTLTVDSSKGIGAGFAGLVFNEVFTVDNFEDYSGTGVGYDSNHANFNALSGLRGEFHSDYYSGGSGTASLFGDSNWSIMGSDTYLYHNATGGHENSGLALFKGSSNGLRYVSFQSLYNVPKTMGKGTTFSFWAHGALSNVSTLAASSEDAKVKVRLFYKNPITSVSDSTGEATEVTIPAGSDWTQYTISLDSNKEYYGYSFFIKSSNALYVPIDDVEIFTANPHETYVAPYPEGTFKAAVESYTLVIAIGNKNNGLVSVKISTQDAEATSITYDETNCSFTIPTTGSVGGYTVGDITGTYDPDSDQLVDVNCSGVIGTVVKNVTLTRPETYFDCEGSTTTLQSAWKRRYRASGANWAVDSGNSDRITSNTTNFASGENGLTVRPCGASYDAYGFNMMNDFSTAKSLGTIEFWVYNPCSVDIVFRIYYYKGTGLSNNGQVGLNSDDVAKAGAWTYVSRGFSKSSIYNFNISVWKADQSDASTTMTAKLVFDNILFY